MFWGIFLDIDWKINLNYSVHVSFINYVISKGDPHPPYVTYLSSGWGTPAPPYFDDVIYAQPLMVAWNNCQPMYGWRSLLTTGVGHFL